MIRLVILELFLIHGVVWCIIGSFFLNHVYPYINSPCITIIMGWYSSYTDEEGV